MDAFATWLRGRGYATLSARQMRSVASVFSRWTREHHVAVVALDETVIESHLARHRGHSRGPLAVERRRATLQLFLAHLRATDVVRSPAPVRAVDAPTSLQTRYELYLRCERGLAEKSVRVYLPTVREFLAACSGEDRRRDPRPLDAQDVRDFLLRRVGTLAPAGAKSVATALRSFLRFLFLRGETSTDLSLTVPMVRFMRGRTVHPYPPPEDVDKLLGACDVATPGGRRDHAVLLLLARLGLHAGEVVTLSLDDIVWRTAEPEDAAEILG